MTRYFKTCNASRDYKAAGISFKFEPVDVIGGAWFGVLAVDDPAASILDSAAFPQVMEVTKEDYERLKKKAKNARSSFVELPQLPQRLPPKKSVPPVEVDTAHKSISLGSKVEVLETITEAPPLELVEELPIIKKRKR